MTTLDCFISWDWQKKSPVTEDAGTYFIDDKITNNVADFQTFDLQKYESGEYLQRAGVLEFAAVNDVMLGASLEPPIHSIWGDGLINSNEVTVLFSDPNTGKSVLAVQLGNDIATSGKRVLYVDFELSRPQFRDRYSNGNGDDFVFSENFFRCNVAQYTIYDQDAIIGDILSACAATNAEVVIIDNLTWLNTHIEKGDAAAELMQQLIAMKMERGLTIIPIAHTVKRILGSSITLNDLNGSSRIGGLIDAAFTIVKSTKDPHLRFIKQLKVRTGAFKYDSDDVLVCQISKGQNNNFLHFEPLRTAHEAELIGAISDESRDSLIQQVKELSDKGLSTRAIADTLPISKTTVINYQKRLRNESKHQSYVGAFGSKDQSPFL